MIDNDNTEETSTGVTESSGGATAAAAMQRDEKGGDLAEARQAEYVHTGQAFTDWFNGKLNQLPNTQIRLGTRTANAVRLHPDGRLECSLVASAGEGEQTFVAFEAQYLDQLLLKFAAQGASGR